MHLVFRGVINFQISAGNLDELAGLGRREVSELQHEPEMLATEGDVCQNRRSKLASSGRKRGQAAHEPVDIKKLPEGWLLSTSGSARTASKAVELN